MITVTILNPNIGCVIKIEIFQKFNTIIIRAISYCNFYRDTCVKLRYTYKYISVYLKLYFNFIYLNVIK